MSYRRWIAGMLGILMLSVSLSGCWDQHPVEYRAPITGIAVDPANKPGMEQFTFLFPNVTVTTGNITSSSNQQFFTMHVQAHGLLDALQKLQRRQSRTLYLGQIRVLVLSERLPRSVWDQVIQSAADSGDILLTFWVVAAQNARSLFTITPPTEVVPDVALARLFGCRCHAILWPVRGWEVWDEFSSAGTTPVLAEVDPSESHFVVVHHLVAVGSQIKRWPQSATRGWAFFTGHVRNMTWHLNGDPPKTLGMIRGSTHLHVMHHGGHVVVKASLRYSGSLTSGMSNTDTPPVVGEIEDQVAHDIQESMVAAWDEAQATGTDPMGLHRLANWTNSSISPNVSDWKDWTLKTQVKFTVRNKGALR